MRAWYCAQTEPNKEWRARKYLELSGIPAFLPTFLTKNKSRHLKVNLLFRGYVFFSLDDPALWPRVSTVTGILRVLTHAPTHTDAPWYIMPSPCASEQIERLRNACLALDSFSRDGGAREVHQPERYITAGCYVRIKDGPLADLSVQKPIVEWAEKDRALLVLSMFGREHKIEFYVKDLELIT